MLTPWTSEASPANTCPGALRVYHEWPTWKLTVCPHLPWPHQIHATRYSLLKWTSDPGVNHPAASCFS